MMSRTARPGGFDEMEALIYRLSRRSNSPSRCWPW